MSTDVSRELENHDTRLQMIERRFDRVETKLDELPGVIKQAINECPKCAPTAQQGKKDDELDGTFRKVWVTILLIILAGIVQWGAWHGTPAAASETKTTQGQGGNK